MLTRECSTLSCDACVVVSFFAPLLVVNDPGERSSEERILDDRIKCWAISSRSCSLRSAKLVPITIPVDGGVGVAERGAVCESHHQPEVTGIATPPRTELSRATRPN